MHVRFNPISSIGLSKSVCTIGQWNTEKTSTRVWNCDSYMREGSWSERSCGM